MDHLLKLPFACLVRPIVLALGNRIRSIHPTFTLEMRKKINFNDTSNYVILAWFSVVCEWIPKNATDSSPSCIYLLTVITIPALDLFRGGSSAHGLLF